MKTINIAAALSILLLQGCFELGQEVVISDGEVNYTVEFGLSAQLAAMAAIDSGKATTDLCNEGGLVEADIPEGMEASTSSRFEAGFLYCTFQVAGSLKKFGELTAGMKNDDQGAKLIMVELLPDNQLRLVSEFQFDQNDDEDMDVMQSMMAAAFTDRVLSWKVTAPEIVSTNGQISGDGKTATWEVPVSVAVLDGGVHTFETVLVHSEPWYQFW